MRRVLAQNKCTAVVSKYYAKLIHLWTEEWEGCWLKVKCTAVASKSPQYTSHSHMPPHGHTSTTTLPHFHFHLSTIFHHITCDYKRSSTSRRGGQSSKDTGEGTHAWNRGWWISKNIYIKWNIVKPEHRGFRRELKEKYTEVGGESQSDQLGASLQE